MRRWRLRAGAAWRRAWLRSAPSDPWDAGRPAHRRGGRGSELLQASPSFKQGFDAWRPRTATLIFFEEPRAEEAAELIRWLDAKTGPAGAGQPGATYRHPVRLLIVNQTLPADLGLVPDAQGWGSSLPKLTGGHWVVDDAAGPLMPSGSLCAPVAVR